MLELFVFGTFAFWVVSAAFLILGIIFVENEKGFLTFLNLVAAGLFLEYIGKIHFFGLLLHNPVLLVIGVLFYIVFGAGWSIFKWKQYVSKTVEDFYNGDISQLSMTVKLDVSSHKADLTFWLGYWPLSFIWALSHQPLRAVYTWLYNNLRNTYEKIADNAIKEAVEKKANKT